VSKYQNSSREIIFFSLRYQEDKTFLPEPRKAENDVDGIGIFFLLLI